MEASAFTWPKNDITHEKLVQTGFAHDVDKRTSVHIDPVSVGIDFLIFNKNRLHIFNCSHIPDKTATVSAGPLKPLYCLHSDAV